MRDITILKILCAIIALNIFLSIPIWLEKKQDEQHPQNLPPCASEDSVNCWWNARTMGNGSGTSFVNIAGTIYFIDESNLGN